MPNRRLLATVAGLVGLTAMNAGYQWYRDRASAPPPPWEFPLGARFPDATFRPLARATTGERAKAAAVGCRLVVFFDNDCPHCHTAKVVEAGLADSIRLPVVWVTLRDDSASATFERGLSASSTLRTVDQRALAPIVLRATPVGFVVAPDDRVPLIVPYDGSAAQHRAARQRCVAPGAPGAPGAPAAAGASA